MNHKANSAGFSLIELMVGMAISMILVAGAIAMFVSNLASSNNSLMASRLYQDLTTALAIMSDEIRRAGYNVTGTNLALHTLNDSATPNCLLYSYDDDADGNRDTFGFTSFRSGRSVCNGDNLCFIESETRNEMDMNNCTAGAVERIVDDNVIEITSLAFTTTGSQCLLAHDLDGSGFTADNWETTGLNADTFPCDGTSGTDIVAWSDYVTTGDILIEIRMIKITLEGRLVDDPTVTKELQTVVRVRNNRVLTAP